MMYPAWHRKRSGRALQQLKIVALLVFAVGVYLLLLSSDGHTLSSSFFHRPRLPSFQPTETGPFAADVLTEIENGRLACAPIPNPEGMKKNTSALKYQSHGRINLINLSDEEEGALRLAHQFMQKEARHLGSRIPYARNTCGVVTTANRDLLPVLLVSLRMFRRTNTVLPVEVFIDSTEYDTNLCEVTLPALNAKCHTFHDIHFHSVKGSKARKFYYKIFAMLLSSFKSVLFLDADAFPVQDPEPFLTSAPFTTPGLVTWPDMWENTASPHFFRIAGIP